TPNLWLITSRASRYASTRAVSLQPSGPSNSLFATPSKAYATKKFTALFFVARALACDFEQTV
ncbi:MAG: hypothetical protein V4494_00500, partial [Chlamydiota bacterium]